MLSEHLLIVAFLQCLSMSLGSFKDILFWLKSIYQSWILNVLFNQISLLTIKKTEINKCSLGQYLSVSSSWSHSRATLPNQKPLSSKEKIELWVKSQRINPYKAQMIFWYPLIFVRPDYRMHIQILFVRGYNDN